MSARASHGIQGLRSLLLLLCLAGSAMLLPKMQALRTASGQDAQRVQDLQDDGMYDLPAPIWKRLSLGYGGVLADLYWTRAVQYFGRRVGDRVARFGQLSMLLDEATTLDPKLLPAYEFGAVFLAQDPPRGAGQPEQAAELLERGIRINPGEWRLYYELGFVHYFNLHDYPAATQAFERGSRVPGAHPWLKVLAARMATQGGDIATARFMWGRAAEEATDPLIRANALAQLKALEESDCQIRGPGSKTPERASPVPPCAHMDQVQIER